MKNKNKWLTLLFAFTISVVFSQTKFPTVEMEPFYDIRYTQAERDSLYSGLVDYQKSIVAIHQYSLPNSVPMSLVFNPIPAGFKVDKNQKPIDWSLPNDVALPSDKAQLAFLPVYKLASLIKNRKISSLELTKLFIDRLKKYGDTLQCVITLMEESAIKHAQQADAEIAKGKYRGPLHGIPFGIKDLLAVEGTKTTWGAGPYKDQVINSTAAVVKKLQDAGAVLTVKLTMGALALGDIWYGGVTKNPWNLAQGSSGSSAGSASATAAGLVPFAIGTETLGSIVSPSTRCGTTGLRPTFGAVSRDGAMALSWSMDKIGPICRSALDCAIVFNAIRGQDDNDPTTRDASFNYSSKTDLKKLRVGFIKSAFEADYPGKANDEKTLEAIRRLGIQPEAIELPSQFPVSAIRLMLTVEAAAAFDELTRSDRDSLLTNQRKWAWPNTFRTARLIPAVDYINASRIRYKLIQEFHAATREFDVIITPSYGGSQLLITNLTGHPCLVMPNGFNDRGAPTSISFLGKLYGEAALISLGKAFQEATEWDDRHPEMFLKP